MDNYILFKQVVCIILFFETLVLWPRFRRYFGPPVFPTSILSTPLRIALFNVFLLTSLASLFFNLFPLLASCILLLCMRYLFVAKQAERTSVFGAVGHMCYLIAAYLFFFEAALALDATHSLVHFLYRIFAIEIGICMCAAGISKCMLGYMRDRGFEFALVNPSLGKFFFIFNKVKPTSWFFTFNNYAAAVAEVLSGLCLFFPETERFGAYLLVLIFGYVFLTVRVGVLSLLMMSCALLYAPPIGFHFQTVDLLTLHLAAWQPVVMLIKLLFIFYIALYSLITVYKLLSISCTLPPLPKPVQRFMAARPYFEWTVFTIGVTHFFVQIEKALKGTDTITSTLYDGFSKKYSELFEHPGLFFRFIHHHESSLLLHIFMPDPPTSAFIKKMVLYGKTLLSESEIEEADIVFTVMHIKKAPDQFVYQPFCRYFADLKSETVRTVQMYTQDGVVYTVF